MATMTKKRSKYVWRARLVALGRLFRRLLYVALICFGVAAVGGVCFGVYQAARQVLVLVRRVVSPHAVTITFDQLYASDIRSALEARVRDALAHDNALTFQPAQLYEELKKDYPFITSFEWRMASPGRAELHIVGASPQFVINDAFVLGHDNQLLPRSLFIEHSLAYVRQLTMLVPPEEAALTEGFHHFLQTIPPAVWDAYTIIYEKPHHVVLQAKDDQLYPIIIDEVGGLDLKKLAMAQQVDRHVRERLQQSAQRGKNTSWELDARFSQRIIARPTANRKKGKG